jgi:REP element-mobilizing transposase RayT
MDSNTTNAPHRRKHIRLRGYDYSLPGNYFVTIVTHHRKCLFGDIIDGELHLNEAGQMVEASYFDLERASDVVDCLDYVVMPNHFHCIIRINDRCLTETDDDQSILTLPELIKRFKSMTTVRYIHGVRQKSWMPFDRQLWQNSFYDHIIRNERAFDFIRSYIFHNPERWYYDHINPECGDSPDDINETIKQFY